MELNELRRKIDNLDREITRLFDERMQVSAEIAAYKRENRLPVLDAAREREKLNAVAESVRPELRASVQRLYSMIFALSRNAQSALNREPSELLDDIRRAIDETPRVFPDCAAVACQGAEGAYSQIAASRLFRSPKLMYFESFESVFSAIESGLCDYGVLPIENSSAGSVKKVYDLMLRRDFKIVRSVRLKVDHSLLAAPGVQLREIREIFSHEQALEQCAGYLEKLKNVKCTRCANTALAAQAVAESGRRDAAAIASRSCAPIYGLQCVDSDIQDRGNNATRFICIARNLEIYPGADRTSVLLTLPHRPGSLCKALLQLDSLGVNITRLESRPIPERDFEFMFYFDLETSVYAEAFLGMIESLCAVSEDFRYLGSYTEVV